MAPANVQIARQVFDAFNRGDVEALRDLVDPECEFAPHITGGFEHTEFRGLEGLSDFMRRVPETWERLHVEPLQVRENGDVVVMLGTLRGVGRASGIEVETRTIWVWTFRAARMRRLEAHAADDPGEVARALAAAGMPPDSFGT
jgi:ketosteroid isomerase-like protein